MAIVSLPPVGNIEIESHAPLHEGRLFDIWVGRLGRTEVVCKTPRFRPLTGNALEGQVGYTGYLNGIETSIWSGRTAPLIDPEEMRMIQDHFLMLEAEQIRESRGAWNHQVMALGVWDLLWYLHADDQLDIDATSPSAGSAHDRRPPMRMLRRPVLVMPKYRGIPLVALPRDRQRVLFPMMLPALWTALSAARHGDLVASNILINEERGRFHLIDPGVTWWSLRPYSPRFRERLWQHGHDDLYVFSTTASAYPLLPPQYGRALDPAWLLEDYLEQMLRAQYPFIPGVVLGSAWFSQSDRQLDVSLPSPADILALGVLYFEILTQRHPLPWLVERPAWSGGFAETPDGLFVNAMRRFQVQGMPNPSDFADIHPEEESLCLALLNLHLREGSHTLRQLSYEATESLKQGHGWEPLR